MRVNSDGRLGVVVGLELSWISLGSNVLVVDIFKNEMRRMRCRVSCFCINGIRGNTAIGYKCDIVLKLLQK